MVHGSATTTVAASSYSVREHLGPLEFTFPGPDGTDRSLRFPYPKLFDLGDFPRRAEADLGVDAVETVAFQFAGPDDPQLDRFAASLRQTGVRLVNVAIDTGDLLEPDDDRRDADVAGIIGWIDRCASMGTEFVRVNAGSPFRAGEPSPPDAPHLISALRRLGEHAADRGTRLLIENHGGPSSDPAWVTELLEQVGRDRVGLLLDLGNFDVLQQPATAHVLSAAEGGQPVPFPALVDALDLSPLYRAIDALTPLAELVHVKVHDVDDDGAMRAVDLGRALGILGRHGYAGPLTIEYEGHGGDPWAKTAAIVAATRELAAAEVR